MTFSIDRAMPLIFAAIVGCGGSQGTEPQSASAAEHRSAAEGEDRAAEQHDAEYDPAYQQQQAVPNSEVWYGLDVYNPSEVHLTQAQRSRELAEQHRAAAESLESYEAAQCASFPAETRAVCPLLGQVASVTPVDGGVRIELKEDVPQDAVADHMRCHVAFAATQGREGMDQCPLYVEGAEVHADGELELTTSAGSEAVDALRERAGAHVSADHDSHH